MLFCVREFEMLWLGNDYLVTIASYCSFYSHKTIYECQTLQLLKVTLFLALLEMYLIIVCRTVKVCFGFNKNLGYELDRFFD